MLDNGTHHIDVHGLRVSRYLGFRQLSGGDGTHFVKNSLTGIGNTLPGSNVVYELLTPDLNRQIEVMYLRFSREENSGDEPMTDPPGEKFGFVLKGSLEMNVGG